ncbi:MAG: hypothetical protein FJ138_08230, partial [Deltaproteobacteria bacterium]|nr:hypothetical protein [Deltaproteobacteria bacterium]
MFHTQHIQAQHVLHQVLHGALLALSLLLSLEVAALWWLRAELGRAREAQGRAEERLELSADVVYLDEVLTMSAWLFAATGDAAWETRYRGAEGALDARLARLLRLSAPEGDEARAARDTYAANEALIALEAEALELARRGERGAAQGVMRSEAYLREKERYQRAIRAARREAEGALGALRGVAAARLSWALWALVLALAGAFGALGWSFAAQRRLTRALAALDAPLRGLAGEARRATTLAAQRQRAAEEVARDLVEVEHRERARLGQALHDELQPLLAAARMQVSLAGGGGGEEGPLARAERLLGEALQVSRGLMVSLMPPHVAEGDLARALEWLVGWLRRNQGFALEVQGAPEAWAGVCATGRGAEVMFLFQAARELSLNAIKHSGERAARLALSVAPGGVCLRFEDDGRGAPPAALGALGGDGGDAESYGLRSLRDRAQMLGGELRARSAPGEGFEVWLTLPLAPRPPAPSRLPP